MDRISLDWEWRRPVLKMSFQWMWKVRKSVNCNEIKGLTIG